MAVWFVSDVHLGAMGNWTEKKFITFLDQIKNDCEKLFLVGDLFDFWFEWRDVVPKGNVRVLAKLASMVEMGTQVIFSVGNHDMWIRDYFKNEIGMTVFQQPHVFEIQNKRVFVAHGDIFGRKSIIEGWRNNLFRSTVMRKIVASLFHPSFFVKLGKHWSGSSKKHLLKSDRVPDPVAVAAVAGEKVIDQKNEIDEFLKFVDSDISPNDYYVFGHLHHACKTRRPSGAEVVVLSDWLSSGTAVGRMQNGIIELQKVAPSGELM